MGRDWLLLIFLPESVISVSPVMGIPMIGIGVVKPLVGSYLRLTFPEKLLPASCSVVEKEKGEYQIIGKTRVKLRTTGLQSPEALTGKDTYSLTLSTSSKNEDLANHAETIRN